MGNMFKGENQLEAKLWILKKSCYFPFFFSKTLFNSIIGGYTFVSSRLSLAMGSFLSYYWKTALQYVKKYSANFQCLFFGFQFSCVNIRMFLQKNLQISTEVIFAKSLSSSQPEIVWIKYVFIPYAKNSDKLTGKTWKMTCLY